MENLETDTGFDVHTDCIGPKGCIAVLSAEPTTQVYTQIPACRVEYANQHLQTDRGEKLLGHGKADYPGVPFVSVKRGHMLLMFMAAHNHTPAHCAPGEHKIDMAIFRPRLVALGG